MKAIIAAVVILASRGFAFADSWVLWDYRDTSGDKKPVAVET
jgi:hypothetical protein